MRPPHEWNRTESAYPSELPLDAFVGRHAARAPDATALACGTQAVTYAQLDALASDLADTLREHGIGLGDRVALDLRRGIDLVVAMVATARRGAAYAALGSDWPPAHRSALLSQLRPAALIEKGGPGLTIRTDAGPAHPGSSGTERGGGREHTGLNDCCFFLTSGTTGAAKVVVVPHRAISRLLYDCRFADLGPHTVIPVAAPATWDAFALELWAALINGGTAVLVEEDFLLPWRLRQAISAHGVNTAWLTASLFNLLVDDDLGCFTGMTTVLTGGERMSVSHARRFLARHPGIALVNGYGPVENTIFTTTWRVRPEDCDSGHGIPIGTPVANTQVYVLNGSDPCDTEEVGELWIAGDGLARCYFGDEQATARAFPLRTVGGTANRMYRTGDLVRWCRDGQLHYLGRSDRQVKVRGRRIEPAQVEGALLALPGIEECAVIPERTAQQTVARLIAFVSGPGAAGPQRLREALADSLPPYLLPDAIVRVDRLPLTSNGKLDTAALLAHLGMRQRDRGQAGGSGR